MYIDKQNQFSTEQAVTATAVSTNIIDTGAAADPGPGNALKIFARVGTAFATLTSLAVAVQTATDAAFTTPITLSSRTYLLAELTANTFLDIPPIQGGAKRYIRMNYTVAGSNATAGTISSGIVDTLQANVSTPDGLGTWPANA